MWGRRRGRGKIRSGSWEAAECSRVEVGKRVGKQLDLAVMGDGTTEENGRESWQEACCHCVFGGVAWDYESVHAERFPAGEGEIADHDWPDHNARIRTLTRNRAMSLFALLMPDPCASKLPTRITCRPSHRGVESETEVIPCAAGLSRPTCRPASVPDPLLHFPGWPDGIIQTRRRVWG